MNPDKDKPNPKRCERCGHRIRGENHAEGSHCKADARKRHRIGNRNKFGGKKRR